MKSITQRLQELVTDPKIGERGVQVLGSLAFKDVTETMTGEEFAVTLATIIAYGRKMAPFQPSVQTTEFNDSGGKVHSATINDGVSVKERIGG
jgi:hypothetical protein